MKRENDREVKKKINLVLQKNGHTDAVTYKVAFLLNYITAKREYVRFKNPRMFVFKDLTLTDEADLDKTIQNQTEEVMKSNGHIKIIEP